MGVPNAISTYVEEGLPPQYQPKSITKISDDMLLLQATKRSKRGGWKTSKNMIIVKRDQELSLINAIRLTPDGHQLLERMGTIRRVIRLSSQSGSHHDKYYNDTYGAIVWGTGNSPSYKTPIHHIITPTTLLPITNAEIFMFQNTALEAFEAAIFVHNNSQHQTNNRGGLLITSDALQDQRHNQHTSRTVKTILKMHGFMESGVVVSPKWIRAVSPQQRSAKLPLRDDFERLLRLDFDRLVGSAGAFVSSRAKEEVVLAVERAFPVW
mmetsp:Transcript_28932/g.40927  ORF Transcript_28932/g.40927 Transcript_28932/m.40927 type:complete len:267 (-) Transcript_28932:58-858(-)|eukprot:CAMPEP_0202458458 /NCGR_PEP_ID=MMETSP1360-20130828/25530_1 /ASSEMBLY_ACC=CAM_ASM_000848 /TAXON_ID=515479 /ORGANISM="Licmophora paradoxa, Strain CCMP2313" /LENGTH=266 /DNA_ID=CAMNT_0049079011 /DNA_START=62 /DNA_END=862 /DNA_ORIENTATION=-